MGKATCITSNELLVYKSDCEKSQKPEQLRYGELANLIFAMKTKSKAGFFANTELRKKQVDEELVVFKAILSSLNAAKEAKKNLDACAQTIISKTKEFCKAWDDLIKSETMSKFFANEEENKTSYEFVSKKDNILSMIPICVSICIDKDVQDRTSKIILQYEKCSLALSCVLRICDKCELLKKERKDRVVKIEREIRREIVDFVNITNVIKNYAIRDFDMNDVDFENKQMKIYASVLKGV